MKVHYLTEVVDRYRSGWLKINQNNGDKVLLPYSTKVLILKPIKDGELIKVLEGESKNLIVAVPYLIQSSQGHFSFFSKKGIKFSKTKIYVNKKTGRLILDKKHYPVSLDKSCTKGKYFVRFPVERRTPAKDYQNEEEGGSRFANSWFPLIKKNEFNFSRFLHYGSYSKGCVTVKHNPDKESCWPEIFFGLMRSRINSTYLATLVVN